MVTNVHERRLAVPVEQVGALLARLGRPGDPLWPATRWPPMVLAGPLAVGVRGAHGPIRYRVTGYVPGRTIEFTFAPGVGMRGTHTFVADRVDNGCSVLRHVIDARTAGSMRLVWPLAMRWLHDAVVEDLMDRAEVVLDVGPATPARWSPWVRLLRRLSGRRARTLIRAAVRR